MDCITFKQSKSLIYLMEGRKGEEKRKYSISDKNKLDGRNKS